MPRNINSGIKKFLGQNLSSLGHRKNIQFLKNTRKWFLSFLVCYIQTCASYDIVEVLATYVGYHLVKSDWKKLLKWQRYGHLYKWGKLGIRGES